MDSSLWVGNDKIIPLHSFNLFISWKVLFFIKTIEGQRPYLRKGEVALYDHAFWWKFLKETGKISSQNPSFAHDYTILIKFGPYLTVCLKDTVYGQEYRIELNKRSSQASNNSVLTAIFMLFHWFFLYRSTCVTLVLAVDFLYITRIVKNHNNR